MPIYDQDCATCGTVEDVFCPVDARERCGGCGGPATILIGHTAVHGIVWSNHEVSSQLGRTFETNAQKRAWHKAHPKAIPVEKGSRADLDFKQELREKNDAVVQQQGFRDRRHYQTELRHKGRMEGWRS